MFSLCRLINSSQIRLIKPIFRSPCSFWRGKSDTIFTRLVTKKTLKRIEQRAEEIQRSWTPVYINPFIMPLGIFVNLKIYHSAFTAVVTGIGVYLYTLGEMSEQELALVSLVCLIILGLLFGYSIVYQRIVGRAYLSKDLKQARFAHLNFWGRREDVIVPVGKVVPLSDSNRKLTSFHLKVALRNSDKVYYLNMKPGAVLNPAGFETIFCYLPPYIKEREYKASKRKIENKDLELPTSSDALSANEVVQEPYRRSKD